MTNRIPVEYWHEALADPTLPKVILNRLVRNARRITLSGSSQRNRRTTEENNADGLAHEVGFG